MKKPPQHWCPRCARHDATTVCRFCKQPMPLRRQRGQIDPYPLIGLLLLMLSAALVVTSLREAFLLMFGG